MSAAKNLGKKRDSIIGCHSSAIPDCCNDNGLQSCLPDPYSAGTRWQEDGAAHKICDLSGDLVITFHICTECNYFCVQGTLFADTVCLHLSNTSQHVNVCVRMCFDIKSRVQRLCAFTARVRTSKRAQMSISIPTMLSFCRLI